MDNMYLTIGENMRYFMYKCKFSNNVWYGALSSLNNNNTYVNSTVKFDIVQMNKFDANANMLLGRFSKC